MKGNTEYIKINSDKATHLKVEVYYSKGGINYFTGSNEKRGIYLSVSPVTRTEYEGGGASEGYTAFSGVKQHLKDMARFSQKALDNFILDSKLREDMINHVCEKNGIILESILQG